MDLFTATFCVVLIYIGYKLICKILSIPRISDLDSRYILVTGCDTGFGNAIAKRLDGLGCHVIAACLTESGETELRKSCSTKLNTVHLDVSNHESVKRAYEEVIKILPKGKGLWGLVNNAGISGRPGRLDWINLDDYHKVCAVNLFGLIDVTMTFLPLVKKEKGRIVNMASIAGRIAAATGPYTVSKYGIEAFSDHLRRDMSVFRVSVSIIEPSFFRTQLMQTDSMVRSFDETFRNLPQSIKDEYGQEYFAAVRKRAAGGLDKIMNEDLSPVLEAYTHALLGRFPSARYLVGKRAGAVVFIQSMPEWLGDRLLRLQSSRIKPAACT